MKILELLTSKDPKVDKQKYSVLKVLPGQLSSFYALALAAMTLNKHKIDGVLQNYYQNTSTHRV